MTRYFFVMKERFRMKARIITTGEIIDIPIDGECFGCDVKIDAILLSRILMRFQTALINDMLLPFSNIDFESFKKGFVFYDDSENLCEEDDSDGFCKHSIIWSIRYDDDSHNFVPEEILSSCKHDVLEDGPSFTYCIPSAKEDGSVIEPYIMVGMIDFDFEGVPCQANVLGFNKFCCFYDGMEDVE